LSLNHAKLVLQSFPGVTFNAGLAQNTSESYVRSELSCCTQRVPGSEASLVLEAEIFAPAAASAQDDKPGTHLRDRLE